MLGPMRKMLGLRRRRRSRRRSTTRRRRRREAADDGDRRRERLDVEGRVRVARLEPGRLEGRRREGGAGEREDHGPRAVARQEQRLRAVPDIHDQKRDGGGAAAAVRED